MRQFVAKKNCQRYRTAAHLIRLNPLRQHPHLHPHLHPHITALNGDMLNVASIGQPINQQQNLKRLVPLKNANEMYILRLQNPGQRHSWCNPQA